MKTRPLDAISNLLPCRNALIIPSGMQTKYDRINPVIPKKEDMCSLSQINFETLSP